MRDRRHRTARENEPRLNAPPIVRPWSAPAGGFRWSSDVFTAGTVAAPDAPLWARFANFGGPSTPGTSNNVYWNSANVEFVVKTAGFYLVDFVVAADRAITSGIPGGSMFFAVRSGLNGPGGNARPSARLSFFDAAPPSNFSQRVVSYHTTPIESQFANVNFFFEAQLDYQYGAKPSPANIQNDVIFWKLESG